MESQIDEDKLAEVLKEIKPTPYCVPSMSYEQWLRENYTCPKCGKPCTVCDYECDYIIRAEDKWLKQQ